MGRGRWGCGWSRRHALLPGPGRGGDERRRAGHGRDGSRRPGRRRPRCSESGPARSRSSESGSRSPPSRSSPARRPASESSRRRAGRTRSSSRSVPGLVSGRSSCCSIAPAITRVSGRWSRPGRVTFVLAVGSLALLDCRAVVPPAARSPTARHGCARHVGERAVPRGESGGAAGAGRRDHLALPRKHDRSGPDLPWRATCPAPAPRGRARRLSPSCSSPRAEQRSQCNGDQPG